MVWLVRWRRGHVSEREWTNRTPQSAIELLPPILPRRHRRRHVEVLPDTSSPKNVAAEKRESQLSSLQRARARSMELGALPKDRLEMVVGLGYGEELLNRE